ncbi:MAG: PqqD family protein [Armatimonadota bacterium]
MDRSPNTHPRRREDLRENPLPDGVLLYSPPQMRAYYLNASAYAVWELCNGTRSAQQIAEELARDVGCSAEDILSDVTSTIVRLHEEGLLLNEPEDAQGGGTGA